MLCQNCGKNEANIKYTQIVNGIKKQMTLCDKCAKELGIEDLDFNMPIHFSSFLDDMFDVNDFIPNLIGNNTSIAQKCEKCGMTYEDFLKEGKFGCNECYNTFSNKIDALLKNIQGTNRHVGRRGKFIEDNKVKDSSKVENSNKVEENRKIKEQEGKTSNQLEMLKERLKLEIKEERYEDAAKTRDEIKKIESK